MIDRKVMALKGMLVAYGLTLLPCAAGQLEIENGAVKLCSTDDVSQSGGYEGPHMPSITTAELERIADLKTKFFDSTAPKIAELHSLTRQLQLLMAKSTIERASALQMQSRINAIHAELANNRLLFELDMINTMPAAAREKMQKHRLFIAAFGGPGEGFSGPPPGFGPPPICVPTPGFGPPSLLGPPLFGFPPGMDRAMMGPPSGRGPRDASPPMRSALEGE